MKPCWLPGPVMVNNEKIFVLDLNEKLEHSHVTIEKLEASVESKEEQIAEVNHNLDEMNMKLENVFSR